MVCNGLRGLKCFGGGLNKLETKSSAILGITSVHFGDYWGGGG